LNLEGWTDRKVILCFAHAHACAPTPTTEHLGDASQPSTAAEIRAFSLPGSFRDHSNVEGLPIERAPRRRRSSARGVAVRFPANG
jgi:hypothetical protein